MKVNLINSALTLLLLCQGINSFAAGVNPSTMKLKVYQVAVAENEDCSNPQVIFTSAEGKESDFLSSPVLGSGKLASGTYNCIMITMDDVIKFTPASSVGACNSTTEYAIDLCRSTSSSGGMSHFSTTDILLGTTFNENVECAGTSQTVGAGGVANQVTLYLRTNAPAIDELDLNYVATWKKGITTKESVSMPGEPDGPSADRSNGLKLASPFVVSGSNTGIFYVDATGGVQDNGGTCELLPPIFGFRN